MARRVGKGIQVAALLLLGASAGQAAAGDIYVCKGAHGEKVYQNSPCATSSAQVGHSTYSEAMARAPAPPPANDASIDWGGGSQGSRQAVATAPRAPAPTGGLDASAYQRGDVRALRCVTASGKVYYARGECGTSVSYSGMKPRDWHRDTVQGVPGAVMTSPNEAVDPMTGQVVQLQPTSPVAPAFARTRDAGTAVDPDVACEQARKIADGKFSEKLDRRARELCDDGRSLYDEHRSSGIP